MVEDTNPLLIDKIRSMFFSGLIDPLKEISRMFPDSMMFGSILMYIITNNISFGVFVIFLLEVLLGSKIIHKVYEGIYGKIPIPTKNDLECLSGYRTQRIAVERVLTYPTYPSLPILAFSAVTAYIISSMLAFKETMNTMSKEWSVRNTVSLNLSVIVLVVFILYRYLGCAVSKAEVFIGLLFGLVIGVVGYFINKSLFGVEAVNLLGLPLLVNREAQGRSVYACAPEM